MEHDVQVKEKIKRKILYQKIKLNYWSRYRIGTGQNNFFINKMKYSKQA